MNRVSGRLRRRRTEGAGTTMSSEQRISALAQLFPVLRKGAPGLTPWDPEQLDQWGSGPSPSAGSRHAVRFVLAVWHDSRPWRSGPFNLIQAVRVWDDAHLEALRTWLRSPWLP